MAVDGNWDLVMQTPMGSRNVKLALQAAGNDLSGEFQGDQGNAPVAGSVDGSNLRFNATINGPMGQMELQFSGAEDADKMSGSVQFGAFGSGTWTASRA